MKCGMHDSYFAIHLCTDGCKVTASIPCEINEKGGVPVFKRIVNFIVIIGACILAAGCAVNRATATLSPGADLRKIKSIYIQKEEGDDRAIDDIIKANLTKRGYAVTTGTDAKPVSQVDVSLTYVDRWMWDIAMYMLELTVTLRNPDSGFPMAVGNSLHTSLTRKSPEEMVDEVIGNIFKAPQAENAAKIEK
jgi:hypothetical protein